MKTNRIAPKFYSEIQSFWYEITLDTRRRNGETPDAFLVLISAVPAFAMFLHVYHICSIFRILIFV